MEKTVASPKGLHLKIRITPIILRKVQNKTAFSYLYLSGHFHLLFRRLAYGFAGGFHTNPPTTINNDAFEAKQLSDQTPEILPGMISMQRKKIVRMGLYAAICWCGGMLMGAEWPGKGRTKAEDLILINSIKFRELLSLINTDYIDQTNTDSLADAALESMVAELDPHSVYISKKDVYAGAVQLESNFEGIGAEFQFIDDTIWVSNILRNSPSDKAGLKAGDKILAVNKVPVSGVNISHQEVSHLVRGPKGTPVVAEVQRVGMPNTLNINMIRDRIQSRSIDFCDMPEPGIGYIKCSRFTQNTGAEMRESLVELLGKGMKSLVLDLRDNSGGYVSAAVKVADEFLSADQLIVYTEGRNPEHNAKTFATSTGLFEAGNVVVLINENTASAAEIVTGALQDHDRALILGRRSFGKGLVQAPITLTDGSEVRLTISRYFTPSGRCIQKGFQRRKRQAYFKEHDARVTTGELYNKDSIKTLGRPVFKTQQGRKVFGGGGIIPDVFASKDSIFQNEWVSRLADKPALYAFILKYFNQHKDEFARNGYEQFATGFVLNQKAMNELYAHLQDAGSHINRKDFEKLKPQFALYIKAGLAKCVWQYEGFYKVLNQKDSEIKQAIVCAPKSKKLLDNMASSKFKPKPGMD